MHILLVTIGLFLIVLPSAIAYHRNHWRRKKIYWIHAGGFVASMFLVLIPIMKDVGGWFWVVMWLIAFILSLMPKVAPNK